MALKSLEEALNYNHSDVIDRFMHRYSINREEALDIFEETKRWLWFCANRNPDVDASINDAMWMIDEMWHTFIVYTKDYQDYCENNIGKHLHHAPVTIAERDEADKRFKENPELYREERTKKFNDFFAEVAKLLGPRTLYKWQIMYREKYTPAYRAKIAPAPIRDKTVTPVFPLTEKHRDRFHHMLYVKELETPALIDELTKFELAITSRWPNHSCGAYCSSGNVILK